MVKIDRKTYCKIEDCILKDKHLEVFPNGLQYSQAFNYERYVSGSTKVLVFCSGEFYADQRLIDLVK